MRKQLQMFGILIAFNKGFDHKRVCGPHGNIVGIATEIALIYRSENSTIEWSGQTLPGSGG